MMARGKYLNLEETRCSEKIDWFCKEHPSRGGWNQFDAMMNSIAPPGLEAHQKPSEHRPGRVARIPTYLDLAGPVLGAERARETLAELWRLDELETVAGLCDALAG